MGVIVSLFKPRRRSAALIVLSLIGNAPCFVLLHQYRGDDINMRSVWLCSRNDIVSNLGVIGAAGAVAYLGSAWPDFIVGGLVAILFLHTSWSVIRQAGGEWRKAPIKAASCG